MRLRWDREHRSPRHPYRDSALLYAGLSGIILLVTALTGGNLLPERRSDNHGLLHAIGEFGALPVAAAFFVLATGFSWWRWHSRAPEKEREP